MSSYLDLFQFFFKVQDKPLDFTDQNRNEENDHSIGDNGWLGNAYVKGRAHVLIRMAFGQDQEYVASFQRFSEGLRATSEGDDLRVYRPLDSGPVSQQYEGNAGAINKQAVMLIGNVQLAEYPQIVALPSLVRFGIPNLIFSTLRHAVYLSSAHGYTVRGVSEDWELSEPIRRPATRDDKLIGEMIESAPQVVQSVANDKRDVSADRFDLQCLKSVLSRLRIVIGRGFVKIACTEFVPSDFQIREVLFGPFDLFLNPSEFFVDGLCHDSAY
jgi:hypothetical protein